MSEFDIIRHYFTRSSSHGVEGEVGIGDDAAVIYPPKDESLAIAADMLLVNRHFFADDTPESIGWKAVAVNLSDLAAMGAKPRYALLSLALPEENNTWLKGFSEGFFQCCDQFGVDLIGGDTTRGPLTIAITVIGLNAPRPLLRSRAEIGDDIWISGMPGLAALGLAIKQKQLEVPEPFRQRCLNALERPIPRIALGQALATHAHAAIDVSDGLLGDLGHILEQSEKGAIIELERLLAIEPDFSNAIANQDQIIQAICFGGDDYELCFTAHPRHRPYLLELSSRLNIPLHRIGNITDNKKLEVTYRGEPIFLQGHSFDHFSS